MYQAARPKSLRQQAIQYLQQEDSMQRDGAERFQPYKLERSSIGSIIGETGKSAMESLPRSKLKLSLLVRPNKNVELIQHNHLIYFAKGKPSRRKKNQGQLQTQDSIKRFVSQESLLTSQLDASMDIHEPLEYKKKMKVKAFTELLKKPTTDCIVGLVTPTELLYKWNMNKLDQNENSQHLNSIVKKEALQKQGIRHRVTELPCIGHYEPQWQKIHPKSVQNVYFMKEKITYRSPLKLESQTQSFKSMSQHMQSSYSKHKVKPEDDLSKMYSQIQNQVRREVNQQISSNKAFENPLTKFSMVPLDQEFVSVFKQQWKDHIRQTKQTKERLKKQLKRFDTEVYG